MIPIGDAVVGLMVMLAFALGAAITAIGWLVAIWLGAPVTMWVPATILLAGLGSAWAAQKGIS